MNYIFEYVSKIDKINESKYFKALNKSGLESFFDSQKSFIHAVDNWSKMLGLMVCKCETDVQRLVFVKNLYDEHGDGDLSNSHIKTFERFMRLKNEDYKFNDIEHLSSVESFNINLFTPLNNESFDFLCGMLGMIEYTYINVSKCINQYISKNMNINPESVPHYSLHETLDFTHSKELFELIDNKGELSKDAIKGINYGYKIFVELYDRLFIYLKPTKTSE